jgi:hypothetical protein
MPEWFAASIFRREMAYLTRQSHHNLKSQFLTNQGSGPQPETSMPSGVSKPFLCYFLYIVKLLWNQIYFPLWELANNVFLCRSLNDNRIHSVEVEAFRELPLLTSLWVLAPAPEHIHGLLHSFQNRNPLENSGYYIYHLLIIRNLCILPTQQIYMIHTIYTQKDSDYFVKKH